MLGLGIEWDKAPIGTTDFLRDWIILGPLFLISGFVIVGLGIQGWLNTIHSENINSDLYFNIELKNKISKIKIPLMTMFYLGLTSIIIYAMLGNQFLLILSMGGLFIISSFYYWLPKKIINNLKSENNRVLLILSILISFSFFICCLAYQTGFNNYLLSSKEENYLILNDAHKQIIKVYDQWTLIYYDEKQYAWIHHNKKQIIFFQKNKKIFIGLLCINFPQYCKDFYTEHELTKKY